MKLVKTIRKYYQLVNINEHNPTSEQHVLKEIVKTGYPKVLMLYYTIFLLFFYAAADSFFLPSAILTIFVAFAAFASSAK